MIAKLRWNSLGWFSEAVVDFWNFGECDDVSISSSFSPTHILNFPEKIGDLDGDKENPKIKFSRILGSESRDESEKNNNGEETIETHRSDQ